jgi:hypothetical protein
MTKYNTGNPVGSSDPRDLLDNAKNADYLENGTAETYRDRLGKPRKSRAGMEKAFNDFLAASGYEFLGDYAAGIEVTAYNQIIRDAGQFWSAASGTVLPYTTTGAGMNESGAFVARGDAVLRQDLATAASGKGAAIVTMEDGTSVEVAVNSRVIKVSGIDDLTNQPLVNGFQYAVQGYYSGSIEGGGTFIFDSGRSKSDHNGISVISPTVSWSGEKSTLADFLSAVGEADPTGTGCFVAIGNRNKGACAGILPGTGDTDTSLFQALVDYASSNNLDHIELSPGSYSCGLLSNLQNVQFIGEGAIFSGMTQRVGAKVSRGRPKYILPTGFSWAPFANYFISASGKAEVAFNVKDFALSNEAVSIVDVFVDYENGDDSNQGNVRLPKKTISAALALGSAGIIWIKSATNYNSASMVVDSSYSKPFLQIKSWSGKPVTIWNGPDPSDLSWTVSGGFSATYETGVSSAFGVFDTTIVDEDGRYKGLTERSSATEVNNNPGSWYFDSGTSTLYVRRYTDSAPGQDLLVQSNGGIRVEDNKALLLENVKWQSGDPVKAYAANGNKPRFYMYGGELSYALNFGLDADGADSFVENVVAYGCGLDNFNYHEDSTGSLNCNAIEINVKSYGSGSIKKGGAENKNGSSMHDSGNIIRINGEYYGNYGPNVIDTTNGVSLNVCTLAEDSIAPSDGQNRNFAIGAPGFVGTMFCHKTVSKRSVHDYYADGDGSTLNVCESVDSDAITEANPSDHVTQYWPK